MAKPKKTATKKTKKAQARVNKPPEVWVCTAAGWVSRGGKRYAKGDTIMVFPDRIPEADLEILKKHFEPKQMEVMAAVSEPIELLDEGDDHGSDSN